ncbi:MAG: DUF6069 family protein [Chloroflexi bacterium]|nr:DUF6069 family protein [Chloroflexota bacterium]
MASAGSGTALAASQHTDGASASGDHNPVDSAQTTLPVEPAEETLPDEPVHDKKKPKPIPLGRIAWVGGIALLAAVIVNVLIGLVAGTFVGGGVLRLPQLEIGNIALLTALGVLGATVVFAIVSRASARPVRVFRIIAVIALLLSFLPEIGLLAGSFGGQTAGGTAPRFGLGIPGVGAAVRGGNRGGAAAGSNQGRANSAANGSANAIGARAGLALPLIGSTLLMHIAAAVISTGLLTTVAVKKTRKAPPATAS